MYVGALRRLMLCVGVCVLLAVCIRYRDPVHQSLQVLQQLRDTQRSLQEALQHAGEFVVTAAPGGHQRNCSRSVIVPPERLAARQKDVRPICEEQRAASQRSDGRRRQEALHRRSRRRSSPPKSPPTDLSEHGQSDGGHFLFDMRCHGTSAGFLSSTTDDLGVSTATASVRSPGRRPHGSSPSSPLVYSILVEEREVGLIIDN